MAVKKAKKSSVKKPRKASAKKVNIPVVAIVIAVAVALISSIVIISSNNKREPMIAYDFGKEIAQGIDVSEHNGKIDWQKVAKTQDFAFIRVGYRGYGNGELVKDKKCDQNLSGASESKIPFGVYFYTQATTEKEAEKEADFVYDIVKKYDLKLPIIIDFEYPVDSDGNAVGRLYNANNSPQQNAKIINAFCEKLEKKGYITGVYASSSVLKNQISANKLNKSIVRWVADYNDRVTYDVDYDIWQYSERGKCDGVSSKYTDLNYLYQGDKNEKTN